jgi:hypothetical protein
MGLHVGRKSKLLLSFPVSKRIFSSLAVPEIDEYYYRLN